LLQKAAPTTQKTMTLQSNCSSSSTDSGHPSGNFEQQQQGTTQQGQKKAGGGAGLRKYLLLLQDCLAIKFGVENGMTEEDLNPSLGFTLYKVIDYYRALSSKKFEIHKLITFI
jgi:hypothetical protein